MAENQYENPPAVIVKAFTWAYEELGWSRAKAAALLRVNDDTLANAGKHGFESDSQQTRTQLAFIRMYHLLYALSDGDTDEMQQWLKRFHDGLNAVPVTLCTSHLGVEEVSRCLEEEQSESMGGNADHVLPVSLSKWEL